MGNTIKLTVADKQYTLEFSRRTIIKLEADGFVGKKGEELKKQDPVTFMYKFIGYAFLKNHPEMTEEEINDIIDNIGDLEGFMNAIAEILQASLSVIEGGKGNVKWERA